MIPTFDFKNIISTFLRSVLIGGVFNPIFFYTAVATSVALIITFVFGFFDTFQIPTISFDSLSLAGNPLVSFVGYLLAVDKFFAIVNFVLSSVNKVLPFVVSLLVSLVSLWAVVNSARAVRRWIVELTT